MKYFVWIVLVPVVVVVIVAVFLEQKLIYSESPTYAVAFSAAQARYLGFNPDDLLQRIIVDYSPPHFRLQANWNEVESTQGQYDFSELDRLVGAVKESGATITLAVGRKLPRWPECHDPSWLAELRSDQVVDKQYKMIKQVVEHYRNEPSIIRWQLENEPLFAYGACQQPNIHRLKDEFKFLRQLDNTRPILLTDSGELSGWWETARLADEQGVTFYQVTWNPVIGYFKYPWPSYYYRLKAALISSYVSKIIVSELQLEPWAPQGLRSLTISEVQNSLSLEIFWENVNKFRATGFSEAFLWGVEWWYYAKDNLNAPDYWQAGQTLFNK